MSSESVCARCGAVITGQCVRCALGGALDASSPGAESVEGTKPELRRIGGYEILDEIGRGGMGVVYRARDPELDRPVAVKVLSLRLGEQARQRFLRECEATGRLDHRNIVRVHSAGADESLLYMVLDYVDGGTLQDRIERDGLIEAEEARRLTIALADALDHAHGQDVLHRDLKPANVLLDGVGQPVLADFGLARLMESESGLSRSGVVMGTPGYLAPEQATGNRTAIGPRTDVYGLGATLYAMLVGQPAIDEETLLDMVVQTLKGGLTPPHEVVPTIPEELSLTCMRCMEVEPKRRFASCAEVAAALRSRRVVPYRPSPTRWFAVLVPLLVLVAVVLIAAIAARTTKPDPAVVTTTSAPTNSAAPGTPRATATPARVRVFPSLLWSGGHAGKNRGLVCVAFGPDGALASLGNDGTLVRWSAQGRAGRPSTVGEGVSPGYLGWVDGTWWHLALGRRLRRQGTPIDSGAVVSVAVDPAGDRLATGGPQGGLFLGTRADPRRTSVTTEGGEHGCAYDMVFAPGSRLLVTRAPSWRRTRKGERVRVRRPSALELYAADGTLLKRLLWAPNRGRCLTIAPSGTEFVVGMANGGLTVHRLDDLTLLRELKDPDSGDPLGVPHGGAIDAVRFHPRGDILFSFGTGRRGTEEAVVRAWAWPSGRPLGFRHLADAVHDLAVSADGARLALGIRGGRVEVYDLNPK